MSRTTLNFWGGVPISISEKSSRGKCQYDRCVVEKKACGKADHTLGIQEVLKGHIVVTLVLDRSVMKQLFMSRGLLSHVLLAESADMGVDVLGVLKRGILVSYL